VSAFLRVYRTDDTAPVTIETTVLSSKGSSVERQSQQLADAAFQGRGADVRLTLPLLDLDPGEYALHVQAHQGTSFASRTIAFTVHP
jgi:hypothetical protein